MIANADAVTAAVVAAIGTLVATYVRYFWTHQEVKAKKVDEELKELHEELAAVKQAIHDLVDLVPDIRQPDATAILMRLYESQGV
jgi:predicted DNA-binding protein with PD1-like motif